MLNNESTLWDKKYRTSRAYDSIEDLFRFSKINPTIIAILPHLKDGMSVLEIGSGTGELISYIQHLYPRCKTYGIDFSGESVERSKIVTSKFGIKTSFVQGDIKQMSFPDSNFDIVFGDQVIGHIDDLNAALKDIYRVTKPGGVVAFSIANSLRPDGWFLSKKLSKSHQGYKQKGMFPWTLKRLLTKSNFKFESFYGEMLFLFRNLSLVKSLFVKNKENSSVSARVGETSNSSKNLLKKAYHFFDKLCPSWLKVTIGVVAIK